MGAIEIDFGSEDEWTGVHQLTVADPRRPDLQTRPVSSENARFCGINCRCERQEQANRDELDRRCSIRQGALRRGAPLNAEIWPSSNASWVSS
jgi:hypothetical protein